jgi:hypothetical protein
MLDRHLPESDIRVRHSIEVDAPAEVVYPIARNLDLSESRLTRTLFAARGLGRRPHMGDPERIGFSPLEENPPYGFVLGLIGCFWKPSGQLVRIDRESFIEYHNPGFGKAVWSFEIARTETGTIVATETRVLCLDPSSRRSFLRYWRVIGPFSSLIRKEALRMIKTRAEQAR